MRNDVFVLLGKDDIEGEGVNNSHVFDAEYDTFTKKYKIEQRSRCNSVSKKNKIYYVDEFDTKDIARNKLAEAQNNGTEVCGNCVSTFYADET